ncbi:MAG: DUF4198 domain-containing protein [Pseudomonadota bacterium]
MMITRVLLASTLLSAAATFASAHYGMIIPSDAMLEQEEGREITLSLSFSHPFEAVGMPLDEPVSFTVTHDGATTDLKPALVSSEVMGEPGYVMSHRLERPGTHIFAMEPQPYWEPSEDVFIIHYTKTYVAAYGDNSGWDAELGLKTEIVPLAPPMGVWEGNVFQGIVKLDGEPVPFAEVEVEYFNQSGTATAPDDLMITQTVKADGNGVFTYAAPSDGWWGFAALNTADYKLLQAGTEKSVELGAVLWVHFEQWNTE